MQAFLTQQPGNHFLELQDLDGGENELLVKNNFKLVESLNKIYLYSTMPYQFRGYLVVHAPILSTFLLISGVFSIGIDS